MRREVEELRGVGGWEGCRMEMERERGTDVERRT